MTSLRHGVTAISRNSKWWERSRLNIKGDNSEERLEEGGVKGGDLFKFGFSKEGGVEGGDLFKFGVSLFSSSFQSISSQSACFDSKFYTNSINLFWSIAIWAQILKVPTGSSFEMIFLYHSWMNILPLYSVYLEVSYLSGKRKLI